MRTLFVFLFINNIFADKTDGKYIDLLPEKEKAEFLDQIARRILEEVQSGEHKKTGSTELTDDELNKHDEYVRQILQEESQNMRKHDDNKDLEKVIPLEKKENQEDIDIDLTLRTNGENRTRSSRRVFEVSVDDKDDAQRDDEDKELDRASDLDIQVKNLRRTDNSEHRHDPESDYHLEIENDAIKKLMNESAGAIKNENIGKEVVEENIDEVKTVNTDSTQKVTETQEIITDTKEISVIHNISEGKDTPIAKENKSVEQKSVNYTDSTENEKDKSVENHFSTEYATLESITTTTTNDAETTEKVISPTENKNLANSLLFANNKIEGNVSSIIEGTTNVINQTKSELSPTINTRSNEKLLGNTNNTIIEVTTYAADGTTQIINENEKESNPLRSQNTKNLKEISKNTIENNATKENETAKDVTNDNSKIINIKITTMNNNMNDGSTIEEPASELITTDIDNNDISKDATKSSKEYYEQYFTVKPTTTKRKTEPLTTFISHHYSTDIKERYTELETSTLRTIIEPLKTILTNFYGPDYNKKRNPSQIIVNERGKHDDIKKIINHTITALRHNFLGDKILKDNNPKPLYEATNNKEYFVYEIPANRVPFVQKVSKPKPPPEETEQPSYVPVYNYSPNNAYYNAQGNSESNTLNNFETQDNTKPNYLDDSARLNQNDPDSINNKIEDKQPKIEWDYFFSDDFHRKFRFGTKTNYKNQQPKTINLLAPKNYTIQNLKPGDYTDFDDHNDDRYFRTICNACKKPSRENSEVPDTQKYVNNLQSIRQFLMERQALLVTPKYPYWGKTKISSNQNNDVTQQEENLKESEDLRDLIQFRSDIRNSYNQKPIKYNYGLLNALNNKTPKYIYIMPSHKSIRKRALDDFLKDCSVDDAKCVFLNSIKLKSEEPLNNLNGYLSAMRNNSNNYDTQTILTELKNYKQKESITMKPIEFIKITESTEETTQNIDTKAKNVPNYIQNEKKSTPHNLQNNNKQTGLRNGDYDFMRKILSIVDGADVIPIFEKLKSLDPNKAKKVNGRKAETVETVMRDVNIYVSLIENMIKNDSKALLQFDWLGSAVDLQSALQKINEMIATVLSDDDIHPSDLELLKYLIYLHKTAKQDLHLERDELKILDVLQEKDEPTKEPDLFIEKGDLTKIQDIFEERDDVTKRDDVRLKRDNPMKEDLFLESDDIPKDLRVKYLLPRNKKKRHRIITERGLIKNRAWLVRMMKLKVPKEELVEFQYFVDDFEAALNNLHTSLKYISMVTKYNDQIWFKNLKALNDFERKQALELLVHIFGTRILGLIEKSARNGLEHDYLQYIQNNLEEVTTTAKEFVFLLEFLEELKYLE